ncbi:MAG: ABC transporter ATP-binding protein, partial [Treponema sp.]|nr:ABC transporter ATP-binding protein [Treponema sp.]
MPPPAGGPGMGMRNGFLTEEEKANRPKVTGKLLKRIFGWLKPYWKQLLVVFIAICISSVFSLLPAVLTGRIIDEGLIGRNLKQLIILICFSLGVTLGANLIGVLESYMNTWIAQHITFDMRNKMYRHLQQMSQKFFTSNNQGDIVTRMTSDIGGVQQIITGTLTQIFSNVITLVVALVAMYQKNWMLATLGVLVIPLFVIPTRSAGKTRWSLTRDAQACNDEVNGILNETLSVSGQLLVKLFGKEDVEYSRYKKVNGRMMDLNIKEGMAGRWFRVVLSTFSSIGPMLLYL